MDRRTKTKIGYYGTYFGVFISTISVFVTLLFRLTIIDFPNIASTNAFMFMLGLTFISVPFTLFSMILLHKYPETDEEYQSRLASQNKHKG